VTPRAPGVEERAPSPWLGLEDVVRVTGGTLAVRPAPGAARAFTHAAIDSRALQGGELFVPLPGTNVDGHAFVGAALAAGAAGSLVHAGWSVPPDVARRGAPVITVADPLAALQTLSRPCRERSGVPCVAVTGSNGKTTTKEMIAAVLGSSRRVHKNIGNQNNHIGLPLTLTKLRPEHDVLVLELAMRAAGEIAELARLCRPDVGVLTVVAEAHLERLGSLEAIAEAKGELADAIPANGLLVVNADDALLWKRHRSRSVPVRSYAIENAEADLQPTGVTVSTDGGTRFTLPDGSAFTLALLGRHNVRNALAAILVGDHFTVPRARAAEALAAMPAPPHRLELVRAGGIAVLDDCYNANPASMKEALALLGSIETRGTRRAVLGDMLELGPASEALHEGVGRRVPAAAWLYVTGAFAEAVARGAREAGVPEAQIHTFGEADALVEAVRRDARAGDLVLVKGSRGMRLERVVDALAPGRAGNATTLTPAGRK
jgi:UDP-N-acetylmuramoyl-tripeptide--D-alanyl-D-alanine ligase